MSEPPSSSAAPPPLPQISARLQWIGLLLFLFIPLVLFLFVRHPEPIGVSLLAGIVLMLGHRFLALPYMRKAIDAKCLWCNRALPPNAETLELATGAGMLSARCCPGHREPAARFFAWAEASKLPLRAGIFLPLLLLLLGGLAAAALGRAVPLPTITALFQLVIGVTVNVAALGPWLGKDRERPAVPFPVHNFFLLGVRNLLWIFRLVGIWWIVRGISYFLGGWSP